MNQPQTPTKNGAQKAQTPPAAAPLVPVVAPQDNTIRGLLERSREKFAEVMPKHLSADRLVRVTVAAIARTPNLQKCSTTSLLNCVMQAAQLGLEPTGLLGGAYLVPYGQECTLIIGYRGLIDLARRSGNIQSIEAHVVHSNDKFKCRYGLDPLLEHEPAWEGEPGVVKAVYAVAKLKDGGQQIEVMTKAQVDAIRNRSKSGSSGPWKSDYDEMARKTVVRRISKYLPLSPELADALQLDQDNDPIDLGPADMVAKGSAGLKQIASAVAAGGGEAEAVDAHNPDTGEVNDMTSDGPSEEEREEIARMEREEAAAVTR